jgi:multidrug efflux pump subunit AcrA (membrane-fusion protein)
MDRVLTTAGLTEAALRADLPALVPGVVKDVRADLGDRVKAGQVLAEIDAPDLLLDERRAMAGVAQAEGLLKEAEAKVATARAEADAAKGTVRQREAELAGAKANLDLRKKQSDRLKALSGQKGVGADTLDEADGQYRAAQSQADAATAAIETAKAELMVRESKALLASAGVGTARADVEAARVGLEKAKLAVARTRVVAPFDGVIARRGCAVGEVVRPGESGAAAPLFTLMRADGLRVTVAVPVRVTPGVAATVFYDALPGVEVAGKVARVGFAVDPRDGTVRAEIDVPNPDGKVRPGMSGHVVLTFGKGPAESLRVPATAVRQVSGPAGERWSEVYVVRDGKARRTKVAVEYRDSREAEVASGLAAGDLVVADPVGLFPHDEVPVVEKPAPKK